MQRPILSFVLGFWLSAACSRDPLEEAVDGERLCREYCEVLDACGVLVDAPPCFDPCMDHAGRGWEGPCRFLREDYLECTNDLTCDELAEDQAHDSPDSEDRPCHEPRRAYSLCTNEKDDR